MEVMNDNNNTGQRHMASILFQNTLRNATKDQTFFNYWGTVEQGVRQYIKMALVELLAKEDMDCIKFAGLCISAIGAIEVPTNEWPDLIDMLYGQAQNENIYYRMASIQTLGYLVEDLDPAYIPADQMNNILYAVLSNFNPEQIQIAQYAAQAFARAAPYMTRNFQVREQCEFIMNAFFQGASINDEDILISLMQGLIDVGRTSCEYITGYFEQLGHMTSHFIASEHDKVANLIIEFWTSVCEIENDRQQKNPAYQSILLPFKDQLLNILFQGLSKIDPEEDQELPEVEENEWTVVLASGCSLEHLSLILKDDILVPVLNFAFPKFSSPNWIERQVGYLSLGAILEGPDPNTFMANMNQYYANILNALSDSSPKVKRTIAWVIYRLAECNPNIVFQSQEALDLLLNQCLANCGTHLAVCTLLLGSMQSVFRQASKHGLEKMLNGHFVNCFQKMMECFNRADVIRSNQQSLISSYMNDLVQFCDAPQFPNEIMGIMNAGLSQVVALTQGPVDEKSENSLNLMSGLIQVCLCRLDFSYLASGVGQQICQLIQHLANLSKRTQLSALQIANGFINCSKENFQAFADATLPIVWQILSTTDEQAVMRNAIGLLADAANYLEESMSRYLSNFMDHLLYILTASEPSFDTKIQAIVTIGDVFLVTGEAFKPYLEKTMVSLNSAGEMSFGTADKDAEYVAQMLLLRRTLLETYIAIVHGFEAFLKDHAFGQNRVREYVIQVYSFLDRMISCSDTSFDLDLMKAIYEIFLDIAALYGNVIRDVISRSQTPQNLKAGLDSLEGEQFRDIKQLFLTTSAELGLF